MICTEKHCEKDAEHTYLILCQDLERPEDYALQMVLHGSVSAILPLSVTVRDGKSILRADVTACADLHARFLDTSLSGSDIRKILYAIRDAASRLPKYLLDVKDLQLDPEYIFYGPSDEIRLCYVPHLSETNPDTIRLLAEFLLKKADHSDSTAVDLAYGLYDRISGERYLLSDVMQSLLQLPYTASAQSTFYASASERDTSPSFSDPYSKNTSSSPYSKHPSSTPYSGSSFSVPYSGSSSSISDPQTHNSSVSFASRSEDLFSREPVRHLSPQKQRKRTSKKNADEKRLLFLTRILPCLIVAASAAALILIFRLDATQIGGMGFLCAALLWMILSAIEKRRSDVKNIWMDDDPKSDDQFYQELLKETYAEYPPSPPSPAFSSPPSSPAFSSPQSASAPGSDQSPLTNRSFSDGQSHSPDFPPPYRQTSSLWHSPAPVLRSLCPDRYSDIPLSHGSQVLGKSRTKAGIIVNSEGISRVHARIEQRTDGFYVTDLFSTNGTFLDSHRLEPSRASKLHDGSELAFASNRYQICIGA